MSNDDSWYLDNVLVHAVPGQSRIDIGPIARWQLGWQQAYWDAAGSAAGRLAREQGFILRTVDARALGYQPHDIRRQIRRGAWWAPSRSAICVVRPPANEDVFTARRRRHAMHAVAAAMAHRSSTIGDRSAAILYGLPTLDVPRLPELTSQKGSTTGRHTRAHVRCNDLPMWQVTTWYGAPVTTIARTIVDLARHDGRDGLMAADAALHEQLVTRADIDAALTTAAGQRGARQARRVLARASSLAESPLESLLRLALLEDGFPEPELQAVLTDSLGSWTYRVDMLFREQKLIVEIDGLAKYTAAELRREKVRESRLRAQGYRVERVLWEDVLRHWPATRARLHAALGIAPGAGIFGCAG